MRNFKNYGKIKIEDFVKILEENEIDWDEFDFRQKKFNVHKETKSIPLIFSEELYGAFADSENDVESMVENSQSKYYPLFKDELDRIENHLKSIIDEDGFVFRAILVKLPAGNKVLPHIDKGKSFNIPRRIHLAITTNSQCFFTVGDITKNLKIGELWEINNNGIMHSVTNDGDTDRIHLILDWVKK
jgi:hypothetical protein